MKDVKQMSVDHLITALAETRRRLSKVREANELSRGSLSPVLINLIETERNILDELQLKTFS